MTEPTAANDYQIGPSLAFSRARWNAVMLSIAQRIAAREALEATFEALVADGTQAALDLIQVNVGPQLETLTAQITALEEQLADLISGGTAPNSLLLGGQLPAFYLALANATGSLPVAQVSGIDTYVQTYIDALKGSVGTALDTLDELAAAIGDDANFAATMTVALGARLRLDGTSTVTANIPFGGQKITNLGDATAATDALNRQTGDGRYLLSSAGMIAGFMMSSAPTGWLKANGAVVSVTTYAALTTNIYCGDAANATAAWGYRTNSGDTVRSTTGTHIKIPDLRGEFIRGWDDARGIDSGRVLWAFQDHMFQTHTHGVNTKASGTSAAGSGLLRGTDTDANSGGFVNAPNSGNVGGETRPRNLAALICIKH